MFSFVSIFFNLAILDEKKWKIYENQGNCKQQKTCQNFDIKNFNGKMVIPNE
jgi:hypothetical protein